MVKKSIKKIVVVKKNEKAPLDKKQKFIKQRLNKKVIINNNKTSFLQIT